MHRTGIVALAGRPNVGKSSLLNAILGVDLAMVSPKAQATRLPVTGIHSTADYQLLLQDLPGLLEPAYPLQRSMRHLAIEALGRANAVLYLHAAIDAPAPPLQSLVPEISALRCPVIPVLTKSDEVDPSRLERLREGNSHLVSVRDRESINRLLDAVAHLMPEGPPLHDPEAIGTQPVRFFVGEYLREAAFQWLEDEVPYAITVEVEEFREETPPIYIRATVFVERESQKGIVIGKGGTVLREIGAHARRRLEALLGERVYLETRVKVLPNWRRKTAALARFGFPLPPDETT